METLFALGFIPIIISLFILIMVLWAILRTADNSAKIRKLLETEFAKRDMERLNKK